MTTAQAYDPTTGEAMSRRSEYDFVIVGGGPNGLGMAAYLAKWGFSVCILEARPEIGGGAENFEPIPGFSCEPHAVYFYGAAAPAIEQLDLPSHGFRVSYIPNYGGCITHDQKAFFGGNTFFEEQATDPESYVQMLGVDRDTAKMYLEFMSSLRPRMRDFLRSIYWTPPYDEKWGIPKNEQPVAKVLRECLPMYDDAMLEMSFAEMMDALGLPDPIRAGLLLGSWGNGPHPYWKGMALPGFACTQLQFFSGSSPVGGMHSLAHALARAGLSNGARIFVNSPVSEIIVHDGVAKGVRVADDSLLEEKTIWANMGVINNTHVRSFPDLVGQGHLTQDFKQRVADLSVKGGSLFAVNFLVKELPEYTAAPEKWSGINYPSGTVLHSTTDALMELMRDVHTFRTHPTDPDHFIAWWISHGPHDPTRQRAAGGNQIGVQLQVPAPEDHRDGPEAVNKASDFLVDTLKDVMRQYAPNFTEENLIGTYVNTPYDSEQRNMGFVGGNWMGMRQSEDEWFSRKPLPELARYRTPIENLYLCHQTSYPGGLCLSAVPYNLMHILKEDYEEIDATTPDWWYPSPWHITDAEGAKNVVG